MDITDAKLDRIRALLAQAEDGSGATDAERDAFAQKAAELMARYMVTDVMLNQRRAVADDPIESVRIANPGNYTTARAALINEIAHELNCRPIFLDGRQAATVYGHRSDLDRFQFLLTHLMIQAERGVNTVTPTNPRNVRSFRRAFLLGFATRVAERMRAGRAEGVKEAGGGAELVLVDRGKAVARVAREQSGPTKASRAWSTANAAGYHAGEAAGDRADLGAARVGVSRPSLAR